MRAPAVSILPDESRSTAPYPVQAAHIRLLLLFFHLPEYNCRLPVQLSHRILQSCTKLQTAQCLCSGTAKAMTPGAS